MGDGFRLEVRGAVDDAEWEALIGRDPRAHVLHHPDVLRIVAREDPAWVPRWFEVRDADGTLRAGMGTVERSRAGWKLRVTGAHGLYGGPVAAPEDEAAEARLARAFGRRERWRTLHRELVWHGAAPPRGPWGGLQALDAATLDTAGPPDFEAWLREVFPMNRRNESNRSVRRGLTMEIDAQGTSLEAFHPLYAARSEGWGVPPIPCGVMQALVARFEEIFVVVARDADGALVGAHVCVDMGDELFAWVGTTERRKDVFPATMIVREEVRWCYAHGRARVNLGSSIGREGIRGYKKLMGADADRRWIVDVDLRPWRRRRT